MRRLDVQQLFCTPALVLLLVLSGFTSAAATDELALISTRPASVEMSEDPRLQSIVDLAVRTALDKFASKNLNSNQVAVTLVDLVAEPGPGNGSSDTVRIPPVPALTARRGSYRGHEQIYPASVVKLFYLAAAHQWLHDGRIEDTPELRRAMRDMIVDSLNEATGYIVDLLTGTTSGPELSPADMAQWYAKRNAVNRYFFSAGYADINVNRKPWCEGPYGREMQSLKMHAPNHRNWLTTDATARLLAEIASGKAVSTARSAEMMELLKREPFDVGAPNSQARNYTGQALPLGARLWSKAGWTSETRHDAAYVELPIGAKFVLVIFTTDHANEPDIIPTVARVVVSELTANKR